MTYRTQIKIIADVLSAVRDSASENGEGAGITFILRKANLSYARLERMLGDLVKGGLIVPVVSGEGPARYRLSASGHQFLETYKQFEEFTRSFGLRL